MPFLLCLLLWMHSVLEFHYHKDSGESDAVLSPGVTETWHTHEFILHGELWIFVVKYGRWMKFIEIVEFKWGKCFLGRLESRVSVEDLIWLNGSRLPINGSWYSYFISLFVLLSHLVHFCSSFSGYNSHILDKYRICGSSCHLCSR